MIRDTIAGWFGLGADSTVKYVGLRSSASYGGLALLGLLVAVAVAFSIYIYRAEKSISRGRRLLLCVFRSIVYSLLLAILFEPIIGIEKVTTVRRNVLVLLDKSASMAIKDVRKEHWALVDAALGLDKAKFVRPREQQALARVMRAMQSSATALKNGQYEDARSAQRDAEEALGVALKECEAGRAAVSDEAIRAERTSTIESLRDIKRRQNECGLRIAELETKNPKPEIQDPKSEQEKLLAEVDKLAAALYETPVALSNAIKTEVASTRRMELAKGLLAHPDQKVFDELAKQYKVRYFSFGDRLEPAAEGEVDARPLLGVQPTAGVTRGSTAIEEVVSRYNGQPIAGVILLTDGAFNEGADPLEVARRMKEWGVPLYPVGIGLPTPDDIGLRGLIVQDVFFPKDIVTVRTQVFSHGYDGRKVDVKVLLGSKVMSEKNVELTGTPQFVELVFPVPEKGSPDAVSGAVKLAVTVTELPGEAGPANNRLERTVRIIDEKIKVLYVEGKPRWEFRYLRPVLLRDPRLDVKFLMTQGDRDLAGASPQYLARYPEEGEEAFRYDLVILGDVPSHYFTLPQMQRMVEVVRERGGSLLMLAGQEFAPISYVDTPIAGLLPVGITKNFDPVDADAYPVVSARARHSMAMLDPSEETTRELWSLVRPMYQVPRLQSSKAANVLIELPPRPGHPDPYPLVSWQYAGTGKAMLVATDQLWRIRFKHGDYYHARFWGQTIQFLTLSRLLGENKRIRLEADRTEYLAGQQAEIHANVLNESFQPVAVEEYTVFLDRLETGADPISVRLRPVAGSPGLYQGFFPLEHKGRYKLRTETGAAEYSNTVEFSVAPSDREQLEPAMQEELLRKMAELSDGRYFSVRELPALAGSIAGKTRTMVERRDRDLWDNWLVFAAVLLCAGGEWFFRRRFHLV